MSRFDRLPEFEKEFAKLHKKYRSLDDDLSRFESVLKLMPTGIGKSFTIIHSSAGVIIVKARLACKALRDQSLRVVYAYHDDIISFVHIEIYFKGDKENEDRYRIKEYIEKFKVYKYNINQKNNSKN